MKNYYEANKNLWNKRVTVHKDSEFYDLKSFKEGKSSLKKIELEEVGDVKGKSILHLQCHFGMDSLSWQRLGAEVTGVDFSEEAIKLAKDLNKEHDLNAEFTCSDIYSLDEKLNEKFDIVFTSYGTIGWLHDLNKWGKVISHFLKPGGFFYIIEFQNVLWMFDDEFDHLKYSYFKTDEPIVEEQKGSYADRSAEINLKEYGWNHPLSDVINALTSNGLKIKFVHEFPFSTYNIFPEMIEDENGFYRFKKMKDIIPLMFSIKAIK